MKDYTPEYCTITLHANSHSGTESKMLKVIFKICLYHYITRQFPFGNLLAITVSFLLINSVVPLHYTPIPIREQQFFRLLSCLWPYITLLTITYICSNNKHLRQIFIKLWRCHFFLPRLCNISPIKIPESIEKPINYIFLIFEDSPSNFFKMGIFKPLPMSNIWHHCNLLKLQGILHGQN